MNSPVNKQSDELAWRIGGPQGSGIDRLANVFGRTCASYGLNVFGRREYHSNIIGRHSYVDYSISPETITTHRESPDVLVTFEAESLCRHMLSVADGGHVIYAAEDAEVPLDSLSFLDAPFKKALSDTLVEADLPSNTTSLLELGRHRGMHLLPLPYSDLLADLANEFDLSRNLASRAINTLAVAASSALLCLPDNYLIAALENVFGLDHESFELNARAVNKAYEFINQRHGTTASLPWLHNQLADNETLFLNGSQSVALGKLAAGLSFQAYYPISPASDESVFLEEQDPIPLRNGNHAAPLVLQVEDEIAAATMACGAALTGARSATSTSGPGFCLMTESIGWAGMNEAPLVVSLYQRGGPSTGMPTRTEQGDLQFAIHTGHGEFPRLVIASGDINDCFYDALQAFNYAERYQLPVIHLLDKALASSSQTLRRFHYEKKQVDRGERFTNSDPDATPIERFKPTTSGISPRPLLGQDNTQHWLSGAEHDTFGQVSEDPGMREQMMEKRMRKQQQILDDLPAEEKIRIYGNETADFTVLTWGSTKGAVMDAVKRMLQRGITVRAIQLRLLWPFPVIELSELLINAKPLVIAECNYSGQLNSLLREHLGRGADHLLVKYNGRPMSGYAVFQALQSINEGNGVPRIVLHNPYE